jgi:hypothetical protein
VVALGGKRVPTRGDLEALMRDKVGLHNNCEPHESNRELFREVGISFIAGGHYNTEKLGVLALGEKTREQFDVRVDFIDLPNEV